MFSVLILQEESKLVTFNNSAPPLNTQSYNSFVFVCVCVCVCCRVRPIGSTSESDTEFDRMKQVGVILLRVVT